MFESYKDNLLRYREEQKYLPYLRQELADEYYIVDKVNSNYRRLVLDTFGRLLNENEFAKAIDFLNHVNIQKIKKI